MKRNLLSFATLLFVATTFTQCSKKSDPPPSTDLKITVIDQSGATLTGAEVKLYLSQSSFLNETNQLSSTKITDATGTVLFTNLAPGIIYWRAEKGCQNNLKGLISGSLIQNKTTTITTTVSNTGTLKMVNSSSNPYDIYVNGALTINAMPGNSSQLLTSAPTGNYSIRVVQTNGITDKTYTGTLNCGATLTTTFP